MNSNYMQVVTMRHYDEAGTPEEKREIAKGFEDALDKTAELNAKYIAEIAALKAENAELKKDLDETQKEFEAQNAKLCEVVEENAELRERFERFYSLKNIKLKEGEDD